RHVGGADRRQFRHRGSQHRDCRSAHDRLARPRGMMHVRFERRSKTPRWLSIAPPPSARLATPLPFRGVGAPARANWLEAYAQLFLTPFSTGLDLEQTAIKSAPLVLTGLAVAVAFRARFWNIGGEGQLYAGAIAAAFIGTQKWLPVPTLWLLMLVCGAL